MLEILKELLEDLKTAENDKQPIIILRKIKQKTNSLESAIEVLEKLRSETNE